jgi:hypothetical protein
MLSFHPDLIIILIKNGSFLWFLWFAWITAMWPTQSQAIPKSHPLLLWEKVALHGHFRQSLKNSWAEDIF